MRCSEVLFGCLFSELKNASKELLFEVWNNSGDKSETFLGLGIVSIDELQLSQQQRLVIPLQGNPGAASLSDLFSGLLTVQFLMTQDDNIKTKKESFKAMADSDIEAVSTTANQGDQHMNGHEETDRGKEDDSRN